MNGFNTKNDTGRIWTWDFERNKLQNFKSLNLTNNLTFGLIKDKLDIYILNLTINSLSNTKWYN
jgi:hypothetical protein